MKRILLVVLPFTLAGMATIGCEGASSASAKRSRDGEAAFDVAAMRPEIEARNRVFTHAHVIGDSAAMVNIFAADARAFPPNAEPVIGRHAIEVLTSEYLTFGITEFREETTAFYGNEDLLIDEGTYVMVYDKGKTTEKGKYVNIWRKEGGEWKIQANIWNSSAPAAAGK